MYQKTYLTLCFFEDPAARVHLNIWEGMMKDRIISKTKHMFCEQYDVKRDNDLETIFCIPIDELQYFKVFVKELEANVKKEASYLKTLIFGKVTHKNLELITSLMNYTQITYRS